MVCFYLLAICSIYCFFPVSLNLLWLLILICSVIGLRLVNRTFRRVWMGHGAWLWWWLLVSGSFDFWLFLSLLAGWHKSEQLWFTMPIFQHLPGSQVTVAWNISNCEPKWPFYLSVVRYFVSTIKNLLTRHSFPTCLPIIHA